MKVIGVTGGFGTGKTFVASIFRTYGASVLDADRIAHDVIRKGTPAYKKIVDSFGASVLGKSGNIARAKLAAKVFGNKRNLKRVNSIVHPYVIKFIKERMRRSGRTAIIVIDAPLLVEANLTKLVDALVVVKAPVKRQIERCAGKFRISKEDVLRRINSQMSLKKKMDLADFVIDNGGARSRTREQAKKVWRQIVWK